MDFPIYIDGYYGRPKLISRTPREPPFAKNGDVATAIYDGSYIVEAACFEPTPRGTEDPLNPGFYLLDETKPEIFQGDIAIFRRTYGNVPAQQIVPGSMYVTKPDMPGTFPQIFGDSVVLKPDATVASYHFYTRRTISSDSGNPAVGYPTGGTYTVTIGGSITAPIAYNASAATLQAALNGLSSVSDRGSVVVTGTYNSAGGFVIAFSPYAAFTLDASALTGGAISGLVSPTNSLKSVNQFAAQGAGGGSVTGGTYTVTIFGQTTAAIAYNASTATLQAAINALSKVGGAATVSLWSGNTQPLTAGGFIVFSCAIAQLAGAVDGTSLTAGGATATLTANNYDGWSLKFSAGPLSTRVLTTAAAHGILDTDSIFLLQGASYVPLASGLFTVTGPSTLALTAASGAPFYAADLVTELGKLSSTYAPGVSLTRVKFVTDFYLPGVTPGIGTSDDIPLPVYQGDPASLLAAIFAATASINYQVGELEPWRDSPILARTTVTLNAGQL